MAGCPAQFRLAPQCGDRTKGRGGYTCSSAGRSHDHTSSMDHPPAPAPAPGAKKPGASVPTISCDSDDTDWSRTIAGYDKSYLSSGRVQLISSSVGAPIAESVEYAIGAVGLRAFAVPVATATVTARTGIKKRANCSVVVEAISPITTGPTT